MGNPQGNFRMPTAIVASVVLHFAVLAAVLWIGRVNIEPSSTPSRLVLTLESGPATHASTGSNAAETLSTPRQAPDPEPAAVTAGGSPVSPDTVVRSDPVSAAHNTLPQAPPVPAPAVEAERQDVAKPAGAMAADTREPRPGEAAPQIPEPPVVTHRPSTHRAPVVQPVDDSASAPRIAMTSDQQRMLDRELRRWSEALPSLDAEESTVNWTHKGQAYEASFRRQPARGDMDLEQVAVEVSTQLDGTRLSAQMTMKKLAFSSFAQFVHRWDPNVQLHADTMDGRFHANSKINLAYDRKAQPVFLGKVTTASRRVNFSDTRGHRRRDDIFRGGLETGVRKILLPDEYRPFADGAENVDRKIIRLDEHTRLRFAADRTVELRSIDTDGPGSRESLSAGSTYLIAAKGIRLHVAGLVSGRVLVYSPERIVIEGDLVYADDPAVDPRAQHYLGLVSDKVVEVAGPRVTGPGDLTIQAAICARRRFTVRKSRAPNAGTLYIYGSLTAGSLSATEPRYATDIRFDKRLTDRRPPGFPMTDRYEIESRDEDWQFLIEEIPASVPPAGLKPDTTPGNVPKLQSRYRSNTHTKVSRSQI